MRSKIPVVIWLTLLCAFVHEAIGEGCRIDLKPLRINAPVFISNNNVIAPKGNVISFQHRENLTLACPGRKNSFRVPKFNQTVVLQCNGNKFMHGSKSFAIDDLPCTEKQPRAEVQSTNITCAGGEGLWKHVNFRFDNRTIQLYRTCYNYHQWESLFAAHHLHGYFWQDVWRGSFIDEGMNLIHSKMAEHYTKRKQIEQASKIIGKDNANHYWGNDMLAKGHLAACVDFHYCSTQQATFFYLNAAPQWQKFNTANWKRLENKVRSVVVAHPAGLEVYTGTHDILQLPDSKGILKKIFLNGDKVPVPKYFWKVVYSKTTSQGVAFIGLNNPHVTNRTELTSLCTSICSQVGFQVEDFNMAKKGLMICCDVEDVRKKIKRMTDIPKVKGILKMTS